MDDSILEPREHLWHLYNQVRCPNLLPEIPAEVYVGIPLLMKFSSYEGENTVEYRG